MQATNITDLVVRNYQSCQVVQIEQWTNVTDPVTIYHQSF